MIRQTSHQPRGILTSKITGTGSAFPSRSVDNTSICALLETMPGEVPEGFSPEWILERTGIRNRHFVGSGESLSSLGAEASLRALEAASMSPEQIDGILLATCTPEQPMPATATLIQARIGAKNAFALDLNAACSGFHHAWAMGHAMIASGQSKHLLIVGGDILSSVTDFTDRKSAILFGDGAGAMILSASNEGEPPCFKLLANGNEKELLETPAGGSSRPAYGKSPNERSDEAYSETKMRMKGPEIFKASVRTMCELSTDLLREHSIELDEIDHVVPHQANLRILEMVARKLRLPIERFVLNIEERGNTSGATVPTALDAAIRAGRIQRGDRLLVPVFGAGITAGAAIARY
jgi:3-oxoacyl-[acyl-carrier-protein] synthase-3